MLNIYFCAPVNAGGFPRSHYAAQIAYLKRFGKVLTEHLGSDSATASHDAHSGPDGVYAQDEAWIEAADVIIADVTFASTGTGMAIGSAVAKKKKVIALYDPSKGRASALVAGCPGILATPYTSTAEWQRLVRFFVLPARVFLFGPPGSGKGTLAAWLSAKLGLAHLSTGDILRSYRKEKAGTDDPLAKQLAACMDAGELVPADVMAGILHAKFSEPSLRKRGFILDGYPPSTADAGVLRRLGVYPTTVLVLDCKPETAVSRQLTRGSRATDTPANASHRVDVYAEKTVPVLATFPAEVTRHVDASLTIDGVRAAALAALLDQFAEYHKWASASYVITPGSCTNPRFHSHVDAVSHVYLRDALKKMTPTASTVKVYPVSDLELGPQAAEKSGDFAAVYTGGKVGAAAGAAGAAATGGAASATSAAAATYAAAAADAHFTPVYKRLANFHRITGNPIDEAFATVQMGNDSLDYAQLSSSIEIAASYTDGEVLVECEENIYEASVDPATGKLTVAYDLGETPFKVDYTKLPAVATAKAMSDAERPRFELHHGFDIAKTDRDEAAPPIEPRKVVDGLTKEAGMSNGGWFVFAKNDVWAYRCNEFSNASYETCIAELVRQSEQLHAWLAREAAGRKVIEQTCSLEKVLAMWPFH